MRARWLIAFAAMGIAMSAAVWAQSETAGRAVAQDVAKEKDATKEPKPPPSVTVIGARDAHGIVDRSGTVRAAVIDFGGFLGVGSRKIVVDWRALRFGGIANKSDSISLELTKEQVSKAPEYKEDQPVIV